MFTRLSVSVVLMTSLGLLMACGSGPCREDRQKLAAQAPVNPEAPVVSKAATERVKVFKPDGSLQCGMGKARSPDDMKKDLGDVAVFTAESKPDGLMHIQACGTPTGQCNVYEINRSDLEKAKKLGFREWTWD